MPYISAENFDKDHKFMPVEQDLVSPYREGESKSRGDFSWVVTRVCTPPSNPIQVLQQGSYGFEGRYAQDCADAVANGVKKYADLFEQIKQQRLQIAHLKDLVELKRLPDEAAEIESLAERIYDENAILQKDHPHKIKDSDIGKKDHINGIKKYLLERADWENKHNQTYARPYIHEGTQYASLLAVKKSQILTYLVEETLKNFVLTPIPSKHLDPAAKDQWLERWANAIYDGTKPLQQNPANKALIVHELEVYLAMKFNLDPPEEKKAEVKQPVDRRAAFHRTHSIVGMSKAGQVMFNLSDNLFDVHAMQAIAPFPTFGNTVGPAFLNPISLALRLPDMIAGPILRGINWISSKIANPCLRFCNQDTTLLNAVPKFFAAIVGGIAKVVSWASYAGEVGTFALANAGSLRFSESSKLIGFDKLKNYFAKPEDSKSGTRYTVSGNESKKSQGSRSLPGELTSPSHRASYASKKRTTIVPSSAVPPMPGLSHDRMSASTPNPDPTNLRINIEGAGSPKSFLSTPGSTSAMQKSFAKSSPSPVAESPSSSTLSTDEKKNRRETLTGFRTREQARDAVVDSGNRRGLSSHATVESGKPMTSMPGVIEEHDETASPPSPRSPRNGRS